jgi:voltage-gated potassium channel
VTDGRPDQRRALLRGLLDVAALAVLYTVVPVRDSIGASLVVRAVLVAVVLVLMIWLVLAQVLRHARSSDARLRGLVVALAAGVLGFAYADLAVATWGDGQFVGLSTKIDAFYFSLTTLSTVGYGDVHAAGQVARALVAAQIVFDLAVLATAASLLAHRLADRLRTARR